jgi:hypothetical protein
MGFDIAAYLRLISQHQNLPGKGDHPVAHLTLKLLGPLRVTLDGAPVNRASQHPTLALEVRKGLDRRRKPLFPICYCAILGKRRYP